jgi:hypothetical protein
LLLSLQKDASDKLHIFGGKKLFIADGKTSATAGTHRDLPALDVGKNVLVMLFLEVQAEVPILGIVASK